MKNDRIVKDREFEKHDLMSEFMRIYNLFLKFSKRNNFVFNCN